MGSAPGSPSRWMACRPRSCPAGPGAALDIDLPAVAGTLNGRAQMDLTTREGLAFLQWQDASAAPYAMGDLCLDLRWGAGLSGSVQQFVEDDEFSWPGSGVPIPPWWR